MVAGVAAGIDHLAGVDRGHRTHHAGTPGMTLDFDLAGKRAIGGEVFVARERKAKTVS